MKRASPAGPLTRHEAFLGFLIAAMDANGHVSREELTRAHHLISSMRQFRRRSAETVRRDIDKMRSLVERHGATPVLEAGAGSMPARLRPAAFALAADLVLADGRLDRAERRFLDGLAVHLRLSPTTAQNIRDVIRIKNRA